MAGKTESQATESKVAAPVGGVDVLAVMDEAQRVLGEVHFKYQRQIGPFATQALASVHALPKARAAVAELVEAGKEYVEARAALDGLFPNLRARRDAESRVAVATDRLRAALAPFQSEAH